RRLGSNGGRKGRAGQNKGNQTGRKAGRAESEHLVSLWLVFRAASHNAGTCERDARERTYYSMRRRSFRRLQLHSASPLVGEAGWQATRKRRADRLKGPPPSVAA